MTGALGYAWFWGAAGSEVLGAITTINSLVITANAAGTQTAASLGSSDNSTNALVFDGLLYQAFKSGSNAYVDLSGDRHRRHRLDADRRRRRRHRRDRCGAEEPLGQLPAVARHHVGVVAGRQQSVGENPRRRQQRRAALRVRERAGRARRRRHGAHLPQQVLHGRPEDARHPRASQHARGHRC